MPYFPVNIEVEVQVACQPIDFRAWWFHEGRSGDGQASDRQIIYTQSHSINLCFE